MWYDYIESMQKRAEQNSYKFTCDSAEVKNEKIIIITSNLKPSAVIRNLSVGFLDEKNSLHGDSVRLNGMKAKFYSYSRSAVSFQKLCPV